jgi:hypothetical protein
LIVFEEYDSICFYYAGDVFDSDPRLGKPVSRGDLGVDIDELV